MTKTTTTAAAKLSNINNGVVKKAAKKPAAVKKKLLMTKEQEASIAETIAFVIKSKVCSKTAKKLPDQQSSQNDVPKSPKRTAKDKCSVHVARDTTAKKTAQLSRKSAGKESKEIKVFNKASKQRSESAGSKKGTKPKMPKSRSPSAPKGKDSKGENKEAKESKPSKHKLKLEQDEDDVGDATEKSITCNDKGKEDKWKDTKEKKISKDKKDAHKSTKQGKLCSRDRDKKLAVKARKKNSKPVAKANKIKTVKKPIVVKVKKLNKPNGLKASTKKAIIDSPDAKKDNQKLKIKEEALDDAIAAIGKPPCGPSDTKESPKQVVPKKLLNSQKRKPQRILPKVNPTILAKKLKAKLKAPALTSTLKNNVVVKNKNKAKLVTKPMQQVKPRKLLSIWNGPKRHRVASLNAMAKVHCLYDNEFRANFDQIEVNVKKEAMEKDRECKRVVRSTREERRRSVSPQPTRTLRSVPGLRAVGKMWDMHDTTSSSEDEYIRAPIRPKKGPIGSAGGKQKDEEKDNRTEKVEKIEKNEKADKSDNAEMIEKRASTPVKTKKATVPRRRKREEVVMDLKDMVVRKRMASLNASAILAASYSVEKRSRHRDSDSNTSDSDDDYSSEMSSEEEQLKKFEDIKKEEKVDCKMIQVHTSPKKVAVILNQDTDVTFTGVYMNSTTRSTHHEGYCHIAGMKYRISATSHTQTAATAVATETILQSTTTTTHENENTSDATPVKSYTPLDALSNMQPPANAAGAMPPHHHHHLPPSAPPPAAHHHHVHHADLGLAHRRHGCATSAFSAPPPPPAHHHMPEHGYVQGYYQPAGPLISVHGHSQAPPPSSTLSSKSVPLSEVSPASTSPLLQPPPPSSAGDSSDSEVIITSVTTAKEALASQQHLQPSLTTYRLNHHYPPPPPPHAGYSAYGSYPPQYYGAPPPPPGPPTYPHHDMCYTSFSPHKYMFRRYLAPPTPSYYQPGSPDLYASPPSSNQQVVSASSSASGSFQSSSTGPPPPTLMDPYPGAPPTLIETYPPPAHYYQSYGPAPPCYTHSPPSRPLNYINATYQTCPCPMQSCSKNVHTGPLAGDSKRSNITIAKESMPLPPVALALPLEPASATGPPSPARGSAGMPPPPSPAGATYQPPPPAPPKQEVPEPAAVGTDQRRKARVGKAMVRNNIAQNQQNTMLLMCQTTPALATIPNTILRNVKREVESPKEETSSSEETTIVRCKEVKGTPVATKVEGNCETILVTHNEADIKREQIDLVLEKTTDVLKESEKSTTDVELDLPTISPPSPPPSPPQSEVVTTKVLEPPTIYITPEPDELLLPCQKTVAENVKVKNMKRKISLTIVKDTPPPITKKSRVDKPNGSYKDLIKKTQNVVKINNGKRKLITEPRTVNGVLIRIKKNHARKINAAAANKEEDNPKRLKPSRPLTDGNIRQNIKANGAKETKTVSDPELIENKEPAVKKLSKSKKQVSKKDSDDVLLSNIEKTIESVVHNLRTSKVVPVAKEEKQVITAKKIAGKSRRTTTESSGKASMRKAQGKPKEVPQAISRISRRSTQLRWSNGWTWHGTSFDGKVFLNSDEATVMRKCYPAMVHEEGDIIEPRDCVLLKAGQRKNELPFVAKIAALWENPDDGEMMMSLLWYYRPEHTDQGRRLVDQPDEVFASRHKDSNSVACIEDKCYVLTYNEYCRYRKDLRRLEECVEDTGPCIPEPDPYPRLHRQPPSTLGTSADLVFFCRKVYDFRQKRIIKNPS